MKQVADAQAKGSTLLSTLDFLGSLGQGTPDAVLARLSAEHRRGVREVSATGEVPLDWVLALWRAADDELRADDPTWIERSGAYAIESLGVQLYRGILRKKSPTEFLTQRVSLFRLYYQPGDMEVVAREEGRAVLRLVGLDPRECLFCRRQTGGLLRSVEIAGGANARVDHVRCAVDGDAFCEWRLKWS